MKAKRYVPLRIIIRNRIILVTMIIATLFIIRILYSYEESKALSTIPKDGNMKFTVQFCSADLIQNSSVGNNWSFEVKINGVKVKEGRKLKIKATTNDKISFSASAKEHDLISDLGNAEISVNIKDLKLIEKNTYLIEVTVVENKGKYLGNTAMWNFSFSVVRKVNIFDIINNII
jgi:hypothetical protein